LAVAAHCSRLTTALGKHGFSVIIDMLQALLGDLDEQVRSEATLCLPRLVRSVTLGSSTEASSSIGVLEALLPTAIKLLKDPSPDVRVSLATSMGELLTLLVGLDNNSKSTTSPNNGTAIVKQHKKHIDETLIPLLQRLLHDSDPEVTSAALAAVTHASRGNVKSTRKTGDAPVFVPVLDETQVLRLLPTLTDLATSPQWRVRQNAVEIVPALLLCTRKMETRSKIARLCMQLMNDTVDAVRRTAAECLCLGGSGDLVGSAAVDAEKEEWLTQIVLPHLYACQNSNNLKQRILCLKMAELIIRHKLCVSLDVKDAVAPTRLLLQITQVLSNDKIVNVRLNVGRMLAGDNILAALSKSDLLFAVEILKNQLENEALRPRGGDRDVKFFASKALSAAKAFIGSDAEE